MDAMIARINPDQKQVAIDEEISRYSKYRKEL